MAHRVVVNSSDLVHDKCNLNCHLRSKVKVARPQSSDMNWRAPWKNRTSRYIFFPPITQ